MTTSSTPASQHAAVDSNTQDRNTTQVTVKTRNTHVQSMPRTEGILSGNMQVDIRCNHVSVAVKMEKQWSDEFQEVS